MLFFQLWSKFCEIETMISFSTPQDLADCIQGHYASAETIYTALDKVAIQKGFTRADVQRIINQKQSTIYNKNTQPYRTPITRQPVQIIEQDPKTQMFEGQIAFDEASVEAIITQATIHATTLAQGPAGTPYATTANYGHHKPVTDHLGIIVKSTEGPILTANVGMRFTEKIQDQGNGPYFNNGFKILGETVQEYYERAQRFHRMTQQFTQSPDVIGLFQEMPWARTKYNKIPIQSEFVGGTQNARRINVLPDGDVGIYWGSGYTSVKNAIDPLRISQHQTVTGQALDRRVNYARLTYHNRKPTNVYNFHGWFVNDRTKQKDNVEDIKKLLEHIINHFKGERVILGGDMNLYTPELAYALAQLQFPHHNVIVHILRGYSDISWPGPGFQIPHFGNVDVLIEAVPLT